MKPRPVVLLAGSTGRLGRLLTSRLAANDESLRLLKRAQRAEVGGGNVGSREHGKSVEIVLGDIRDRDSVRRAVRGAQVVISAFSAFGSAGASLREVDGEGNENLIETCEDEGVEHFVLVSVRGAAPDHPMELHRLKYRAESRLMRSRLSWTILRPSSFTETFLELICAPLVHDGKAMIFGQGRNPVNFVSAHDVATYVQRAMTDASMRGHALDIGGPDNLTLTRLVELFAAEVGLAASAKHIPRFMMRLLSVVAAPINPTFARQVQAGVIMDTRDMRFDAAELQRKYPEIRLTSVAEVARREYGSVLAAAGIA